MDLINYLLKVNIAIMVFFAFFRLLFQRDTFFRCKRMVLLSLLLISLMYPLASLPMEWIQNKEIINTISGEIININLPEILVTATQTPQKISFLNIISGIYTAGAILLFIWMNIQIFHIIRKIYQSRKTELFGETVNVLENTQAPFSFFKWIVLDPEAHNESDLKEIILHEKTHASQCHSLDVILCELMCAICWFNPFIWLMKREVRMNLEFLADNSVVSSGCNTEHYQLHLLRLSYHKAIAQLSNNFNVSPLKKRIQMMNKRKTPWVGLVKYTLFLPLTAIFLFANNVFANKSAMVLQDNADVSVVVPKLMPSQDDKPVFTHVEEMPQFPGGDKELMTYLSTNIKYPKESVDKGIQGIVVVRFIVGADGTIRDTKVLRNLDSLIDNEALRVVKAMPKWIPGKQNGKKVDVFYTLPINFRLSK